MIKEYRSSDNRKEDVIQKQIVANARYKYGNTLEILHVPNEVMGLLTPQQKIRWMAMGFVPGFVDLQLEYCGRIGYLEIKQEKGRLTDAERSFLIRKKESGFWVGVAYGADAGNKAVEDFVNGVY